MAGVIRVLYVDDEPGLLEIARLFLEQSGEFSVDTMESAPAALAHLKGRTCDAIVSDYLMPRMDGIEFLKAVRATDKDTPFILFTGRGCEEVVIHAINNGADFYLQKGGDPLSQFAELAHKIRQAVARRRAEHQGAESEKRFHDIIDFLPDATFAIDRSGTVMAWNHAMEEMTGVQAAEMLGKGDHEYAVPFYGRRRPILIDLVFSAPEGVEEMYSSVRRDQDILTAESTTAIPLRKPCVLWGRAAPLVNSSGEVIGAIESIRDITESKEAEERLRISEARYRSVVDDQTEMIARFTRDGIVTFTNQAYRSYFSPVLGRDDLVGKPIRTLMQIDNYDVVEQFLASLTPETPLRTMDRVVTVKDGKTCYQHWSVRALFDGNGKAAEYQVVGRDITDRKKVEDALRESEEKFRSVFESSPYPIAITSHPENKFLEINKAFLAVSGYTAEEILGKDPVGLGLLSLTEMARLISTRLLNGRIENVPLALTAKGGRRIHVLFSSMPITIGDKPATLTVTAETTNIKRVEEDLLTKNEELNAANEELIATGEKLRQQYDELCKKEEEIRSSEEKFRALVELSLDGILITDFIGKILFTNRAAGLIFEMPEYEAVIGRRNVMEYVAPESRADVARDFSTVAGGTDSYLSTYQLITETKREIHVECIGKKILFSNQPAILVSLRDITERKRAEEAVAESEKKFATVFQKSPVALTLVSAADGRFLDVNDTFSQSTGYSRDEVVGRLAGDLSLFADSTEYEQFVSAMREKGSVRGMELKCRQKSGTVGTCRFSSSFVVMNGHPHILSSIEDVTEWKKAEEALRQNEEKFRSLIETSPDMIWELDREGRTRYISPIVSRIMGYTPEELAGKPISSLMPQEMQSLFTREFSQHIFSGGPFIPFEVPALHRNGSTRIIEIRASRIIGSDGTFQGFRGMARDITRSKEIEEELRESEEKFRKIFESSPIAMTLVAPDFRFYSVNPAFIALTGYTEEELLKMTFKDITHPDYLAGDLENLKDLAAGKIPVYSTEKKYIMKDNKIVRGLVRVTALRDQEGTLRYFATQIEDITERTRDEEALRQANKKLNLLSGITRHDIKNQLLVLDGYIALLHKKIPDPAYKELFSGIMAESRLIANLIHFTKEYEMVGVHAPAWQDIRTLADGAARDVAHEPIRIQNHLPAGTEVFADPLSAKVFFNLVDNAVRHGGKITKLRFSLEEQDGDRVIVCADDGDGVSAEEKELIFDLGYGKNTGFGLAISRQILDITGITIRETGTPGKGARFEITVPKGQYRSRT